MTTLFILIGIYLLWVLIFIIISIFDIPINKIGIPIFGENVKWTWFIFRNLKKAKKVESDLPTTDVFRIKDSDYYIVFFDSWLYNIVRSESQYKLGNKYDLGGQSNKADYLTWWQKIIGRKIENWYLSQNN